MGEARRRGTFEERKARAVAAGRVKQERPAKVSTRVTLNSLFNPVSMPHWIVIPKGKKRA